MCHQNTFSVSTGNTSPSGEQLGLELGLERYYSTVQRKNVRVLEVEGCRSSVVIALVAKASGPGFDSRRQLRFFHTFPLLISRPV